jgi:hypothetical protein
MNNENAVVLVGNSWKLLIAVYLGTVLSIRVFICPFIV